MRSRTVSRKLLYQFGYDDPLTKSKRLYRYEKDRTICRDASPKTATRWDKHFADPTNAGKEEELDSALGGTASKVHRLEIDQVLLIIGIHIASA